MNVSSPDKPPAGSGLLVAVLAAGLARRFGGGKLDAPCAGKPLGAWVLDVVARAGLAPGIIVTGTDAPRFAREAAGWQCVTNADAASGLASSLRLAGQEALRRGSGAMLVLLADMPLMPPTYLRDLAAAEAPAATRQEDGRPGVPALLPRAMFADLAQLSGDRGAGPLLAGARGLDLRAAPEGALADVDTAEQLAAVARVLALRG